MSHPEQPSPKKWKLLLINWLFIYPTINVLFYFLFPLMKELPQLGKTFILTILLVPVMGMVLPKLHQRFWSWITQ